MYSNGVTYCIRMESIDESLAMELIENQNSLTNKQTVF